MKPFADDSYQCIQSINHRGIVFSFGGRQGDSGNIIEYRILDLGSFNPENPFDESNWTEIKTLSFPSEIRQVGMNLVTLADTTLTALNTLNFVVCSDTQYIYVFRQNQFSTLQVDRFVFVPAQKELQVCWENRYQRSGKKDTPSGRKDTLGFKDMDGTPFQKPSIALPMVQHLGENGFSVALTNSLNNQRRTWHLFALNSSSGKMDYFSLPAGDTNIFDLSSKTIDPSSGALLPDQSFSFTYNNGSSETNLPFAGGQTCCLYYKQEASPLTSEGTKLKRNQRLMTIFTVTKNGSPKMAVMDLGIAKDGSLAEMGTSLSLPMITEPTTDDGSPMGMIASDANMLTICGGLLDFISNAAPPNLLDSADGNVHLYFQQHSPPQEQSNFAALSFSAETARIHYGLSCNDNSTVEAIARQNGAAMNQSLVVLENGSDDDLCQVRLRYTLPSGSDVIRELWAGVPRNLQSFLTIFQAGAIDDPNSPNLRQQGTCFFDYAGRWLQQAIMVQDAHVAAGFVRIISRLPKSSLTIDQSGANLVDGASSDQCQLTLTLQVGNNQVQEIWNKLPRDSSQLTDILTGKGNGYDYESHTTISKAPYRVPAGSGWIWLLKKTNSSTSMGKVVISITGPDNCMITLGDSDSDGHWTIETWKNMPRAGDRIVAILSGEDSHYDYAMYAASSTTQVDLNNGSSLFTAIDAQTNGLVEQTHLEYVPTLRGGSILFQVLNNGNGAVTNTVTTTTQGITASGSQAVTNRTSSLFTFALQKEVADIALLSLINTPGSGAPRLQEGKDCAWVRAMSEFSLKMSYSCIDFPPNKLDFGGDMTLEAWVNPDRLSQDTHSRIIHYRSNNNRFALGLTDAPIGQSDCYSFFAGHHNQAAVTTDSAIPFGQWSHLAATYATGQCLLMNGVNLVNCGNNISQNVGAALTLEVWAQFPTDRNDHFILLSKFGHQIENQSYQLTYEAGYLKFRVVVSRQLNDTEPQSLEVRQQFNPDLEWHHISATCATLVTTDLQQGYTTTDITLTLYVDGESFGTSTDESFDGNIQIQPCDTALTIGGVESDSNNPPQPLSQPFKVAEARLWQRALSDTDIWNNFDSQRLAVDTTELVSYWALFEGQGLEAIDQQKVNNGVLSNSKMWKETSQGSRWNLYLNGQLADCRLTLMTEFGGYGPNNWFHMGALQYGEDFTFPLLGCLDEVCIWNLARTEEQLRNTMFATMGGSEDKLLGYWNFNQGSGNVLPDQTGQGLNGQFLLEELTEFQAQMNCSNSRTLTMNIRFSGNIQVKEYSLKSGQYHITVDVGTHNAMWLELVPDTDSIDMSQNGGTWQTYTGRSQPQLTTGTAVDLAFRPSDGSTITHATTHSAQLSLPSWNVQETAPVGEEAPQVRQIANGHANPLNVNILGQPAVVEYGDPQVDSNNNLFGVMSRAYMFLDENQKIQLVTEFKVGDLDLQFIGQVQTAPTLAGYIEGPPPVPSENLTVNDPVVDDYVGTSSISLTEEDGVQYHFQSNEEKTFDMSVEGKAGAYFASKTAAGIGVQQEVSKWEVKIGLQGRLFFSTGSVEEKRIAAGSQKNLLNNVDCCGAWEFPKDYNPDGTPQYLNPQVGRRYVPNNMGYALVRSGTADLFALRLKRKATVVSYQVVPNAKIPDDLNIIMFPINPAYVKNGTLDGMVGLVPDEQYPNAILGERGSYFKPEEAYSLKAAIDQEESEIQSYFIQTSGGPTTPEGELLRDWQNKLSKRSLVNTYVWTAPGGLYTEERQFTDILSESSGSTYYFEGMGGLAFESKIHIAGIGLFFELDLLFGGHLQKIKISGQEQTNTFGLSVSVTGEGWLNAWNDTTKTYEPFDCPGKVDGYRFMTYRLAPKESHFDTFFNQVVDDNWLRNSTSPYAIALNEVKYGEKNPVWRVLHRVTFVSRIPPPFEPSPVESPPPDVTTLTDLAGNAWLLQLVEQALGQTSQPSPSQIGAAVDQVLDVTLVALSPTWADFHRRASAQVAHPEENKILESIRLDSKHYYIDLFTALSSNKGVYQSRV